MDTKNKKPWIRCQSKTKPGNFYMFNTTTGEKKWCNSSSEKALATSSKNDTNTTKARTEPPLKFKSAANSLHPAQDRLKRLQSKLKKDIEKNKNSSNTNTKETAKKCKEQKTPATMQPPVTGDDAQKSFTSIEAAEEVAKNSKELTTIYDNSRRLNAKCAKRMKLDNNEAPSSSGISYGKTIVCGFTCKSIPGLRNAMEVHNGDAERPESYVEKTNAKSNDGMSNNSAVQATAKKLQDKKYSVRKDQVGTPPFRRMNGSNSPATPRRNAIGSKDYRRTPQSGKRRSQTPIGAQSLTCSFYWLTLPSTRLANERLQHLRKSLCVHQMRSQASTFTTNVPKLEDGDCFMDWQPSEVEREEKTKIEMGVAPEDDLVSEYYSTVNENLLRIEAENSSISARGTCQWFTKHYYFIIDTNVVLQNCTFLEELSQMKLCDTEGTILYLPYAVLQELDKLKMHKSSKGTNLLAARAIKFLNTQINNNDRRIHVQSAIDERQHEIIVRSADDSIINCCLQVKSYIDHVILLTEDINLRNKASVNGIVATSKSDLISKQAIRIPKSE